MNSDGAGGWRSDGGLRYTHIQGYQEHTLMKASEQFLYHLLMLTLHVQASLISVGGMF